MCPDRPLLPEVQRRAGAQFVEWEGRRWVDHFGDPRREHHGVRSEVGVWDLSPLRKWEFRGRRAVDAADHIFTHDIRALHPGEVRYSPFCDGGGRMVGDATVFKVGEERLWTFTARDADGDHFRAVAGAFGVTVHPRTDELACLQVQGPGSRTVLGAFVPDIGSLAYFRFRPEPVPVAGAACWVARVGYSGELGYELFCRPDEAGALWHALLGAGARPYGLAAADTLRIEAGLILIGREYVPHRTSPYDLSLDRLIRLDKDAFIGKAALQEHAAGARRCLVTAVADATTSVPPAGAPITTAGRAVGIVTSSCRSPTFDAVVALGVVDRTAAQDGRGVEILAPTETIVGAIRTAPMRDARRRRTGC